MSGDPGERALAGRADGEVQLSNGQVVHDNQTLPWRPVELYRRVTASRDRKAARNRGPLGQAGLGGPPAGQSWDTPSHLDQETVLAEELSKVFVDSAGKDWTLHDMVVELFKDLQKRQGS